MVQGRTRRQGVPPKVKISWEMNQEGEEDILHNVCRINTLEESKRMCKALKCLALEFSIRHLIEF
jgi:hypothetical protein